MLKVQGYQTPKKVVLVCDSNLLSFEKVLIYSNKRVRDFPFKLPLLSCAASEELEAEAEVDSQADVAANVGPSTSNINLGEGTQMLSLIIQKLENEVLIPLRRLRSLLLTL